MSNAVKIAKLNNVLLIDEIECADGPASFTSTINMSAVWFTYQGPFFFTAGTLKKFLDSLEEMQTLLHGEAKLESDFWGYDGSYVELRCTSLGHVVIAGEFHDRPVDCHIKISFTTDQTVLQPFIDKWKSVLKALKVKLD